MLALKEWALKSAGILVRGVIALILLGWFGHDKVHTFVDDKINTAMASVMKTRESDMANINGALKDLKEQNTIIIKELLRRSRKQQ